MPAQGQLSAGPDETLPKESAGPCPQHTQMLDLLVIHATLPDGRQDMSIACLATTFMAPGRP